MREKRIGKRAGILLLTDGFTLAVDALAEP